MYKRQIGGLAIDIGTTTVSALLINMLTGEIIGKASAGNGQIRYGADVINRIIESMKPGGSEKLQKAVIDETINPLIQQDVYKRQALHYLRTIICYRCQSSQQLLMNPGV